MDGAIYGYLSPYSALYLLRANRIYPLVFPPGVTLPAQTYQLISAIHERVIKAAKIKFCINRYQVTSFGKNRDDLEALANTTLTAMKAMPGTISSNISVKDTRIIDQSQDYDPVTAIYAIRQDWSVWHEDSSLW